MSRITIRPLWIAAAAFIAFGCGRGEDFDTLLDSGESLYSQAKEELIIRHFFEDRRDGFFVDVGAFHWKIASTTYYLDEHLGWTGIAIDAIPHLVDGYVKNRPRTKFENYFVSDRSGESETFYRAGPVSSMSKEHVEKLAPGKYQVIEVPTITLDQLLDAHGVEKIDFMSMDIELAEPAALAGFDIDRFRPELVCIEAAPQVRDQIASYFEQHGYERIDAYLAHDIVNWYYTPAR
jgi:FkbM family methyltransferase